MACDSPVSVFKYHNPLVFLHKIEDKKQWIVRWSSLLQEYNLDIGHMWSQDKNTDFLSRLSTDEISSKA